MFSHRHLSFVVCIRVIIRFTVSSIRSSFGLLDGVFFLSPNRVLSLGFCWSFFIGFTPVQQSLQEYLGVSVGYPKKPARWVSGVHKQGSKECSKGIILEGVISVLKRSAPLEPLIQTSRECLM